MMRPLQIGLGTLKLTEVPLLLLLALLGYSA